MNCAIVNQILVIIGFCVIHIPLPSETHYVPENQFQKKTACALARSCNHTFVDQCAKDPDITAPRVFQDDCDRWEYNCDTGRRYEVVKYNICFSKCHGIGCPSCAKNLLRGCSKGRYSPFRSRQLDPYIQRHPWHPHIRKKYRDQWSQQLLPMKRYDQMTMMSTTTLKTTRTFLLKKELIWKDGKRIYKVIKAIEGSFENLVEGVRRSGNSTTKADNESDSSGYLER